MPVDTGVGPGPISFPIDFSHTGHPLMDFLIDAVVLLSVTGTSLWGFWKTILEPRLAQIAQDSAATKEQTVNKHQNATHPNLRDDLDAKHASTESTLASIREQIDHIGSLVGSVITAQERQDKELSRIHDTLGADREAVRRVETKIDNHIRDKRDFEPRLMALEQGQKKPPAG